MNGRVRLIEFLPYRLANYIITTSLIVPQTVGQIAQGLLLFNERKVCIFI